jgi:hypothetical protein
MKIIQFENVFERLQDFGYYRLELPFELLLCGFLVLAGHSPQPPHERGHESLLSMASEKKENRRLTLRPLLLLHSSVQLSIFN